MLTTVNEDVRHGVTVYVGFALLLFALILFLAFLSHLLGGLRPATLASHLAESGFDVIDQTYARLFSGVDPPNRYRLPEGEPTQVIHHQGPGQAIQAIHYSALLKLARQETCTIALAFSIGDYVRTSGILAQVYGAKQDIPAEHIVNQIAAGAERTTDQDPGFLLRVLVDIAIKALSPAINDPTTATACIDGIEDLLTLLSHRDLAISQWKDEAGVIRLIVPCHTWEDFLWLGVTEVRIYGTGSIQTMRRLQLMLERLLRTAPEPRRPPIEHQLALLGSSVAAGFSLIPGDYQHAIHVDLL